MSQSSSIAIYGGTFDPFHYGHIYCIQNILEKTKVDQVHVIPAFQNPLKELSEGPSPQQRYEIAKIALSDFENVTVDDQEIQRGGKSYTVDTVDQFLENHRPEDINLIIGLDSFYQLPLWKDYEKLLESCNLIVISRPGHVLPFSEKDLPPEIAQHVVAKDYSYMAMKSGRTIEFLRVPGLDIQATDVRKRLKTGRNVNKFLDLNVQNYIKENDLYPLIGPKVQDYKSFTHYCAQSLFGNKAFNLRGFDLEEMDAPAQYVLICSGTSKRHTQSLAESLCHDVKNEFGMGPLSLEGTEEGRWVLVDFGGLIVHVFYDYLRMDYNIESLWKGAVDMDIKDVDVEKLQGSE